MHARQRWFWIGIGKEVSHLKISPLFISSIVFGRRRCRARCRCHRRRRFVCQRCHPFHRSFKWLRHFCCSRLWWFNVYFCHESDNNFCLTYISFAVRIKCGSAKCKRPRGWRVAASSSTRQSIPFRIMRIEKRKTTKSKTTTTTNGEHTELKMLYELCECEFKHSWEVIGSVDNFIFYCCPHALGFRWRSGPPCYRDCVIRKVGHWTMFSQAQLIPLWLIVENNTNRIVVHVSRSFLSFFRCFLFFFTSTLVFAAPLPSLLLLHLTFVSKTISREDLSLNEREGHATNSFFRSRSPKINQVFLLIYSHSFSSSIGWLLRWDNFMCKHATRAYED